MKNRLSRANNGIIGVNQASTVSGVITPNKNYVSVGYHPPLTSSGDWIRPSGWLNLPSMTQGDNKFAGLFAVFPGDPLVSGFTASTNYVALQITGTTFTVDWGNGTSLSYPSGATAQFQYDYSTIPTGTQITGDSGLNGYRQVLIQAYPAVGVGATGFSEINLDVKHDALGPGGTANYLYQNITTNWLDIKMASPSLRNLMMARNLQTNVNLLRQFEYVGTSSLGTDDTIFYPFNVFGGNTTYAFLPAARSLVSVKGTEWTANMKNFLQFFLNCNSLKYIPLLNTSKGTTFTSMFSGCVNLETLPPLDLSSGQDLSYMFNGCKSLRSIPQFNTSACKNFSSTFLSCISLQTIPFLNTSACTNFSGMFNTCYSLRTIPQLDTSSGTIFNSMFNGCYALQTIPQLNTSLGTNFSYMFSGCTNLQTIPQLNTSSGTNFSNMFSLCYALQTIPQLNTSSGINFSSMFNTCYSLRTIPQLDTSSGTNFGGMFSNCSSLQTIPQLNTTLGTSFATMFYNCSSIQTVPGLTTSSGTDFSSMFNGCLSLRSVGGELNTVNAKTLSQMFYQCGSLQYAPILKANSLNSTSTSLYQTFAECYSLQSCGITGFRQMVPIIGMDISSTFVGCFDLKDVVLDGMLGVSTVTTLNSNKYSRAEGGTYKSATYSGLSGCNLSAAALDKLFTSLGTNGTSMPLWIGGNPGATACNRTIATNKNWNVIG